MEKDAGNTITKSITTAFLAVVMLLTFASCRKEKKEFVPSFSNKDSVPEMDTRGMTMLISDSGVTRYRIKAEVWQVFDRKKDPYQYFPKGIYLEQFDTLLHVEATVESDTAWYYTDAKLFELRGNVKVMNRKGEKFSGEELFWNEKTHLVYSDKLIKIESDSSYTYAYGFESDQSMTKYIIRDPRNGEMFFGEDSITSEPADSISSAKSDSVPSTKKP